MAGSSVSGAGGAPVVSTPYDNANPTQTPVPPNSTGNPDSVLLVTGVTSGPATDLNDAQVALNFVTDIAGSVSPPYGGLAVETADGLAFVLQNNVVVQLATPAVGGSPAPTITVQGGSGNETILGGANPVLVNAGSGPELIVGGSAGSTINGGAGNETIAGGAGPNVISAGTGLDSIVGGSGPNTITGGAADTIQGGAGPSTIYGGVVNTILGAQGNNLIYGGGDDMIVTGAGSDTVFGAPSDSIAAGAGLATIHGEAGLELIVGNSRDTQIYGGAGDTILPGSGTNEVTLGAPSELFSESNAGSQSTITGFQSGDSIQFAGETPAAISAVIASATVSAAGTTLNLPDGSTILLAGISKVDGSFFS
jgi:Ca2+-binding RTX toxin-like protein